MGIEDINKVGDYSDKRSATQEPGASLNRLWNFLGEPGHSGKRTIITTQHGEITIDRGHTVTASGDIAPGYVNVHLSKFNHRRWGVGEGQVVACMVTEKGLTYLETRSLEGGLHKMRLGDTLPWPTEDSKERVQQALGSSLADFLESQARSQ